jgi:hypothetical protein
MNTSIPSVHPAWKPQSRLVARAIPKTFADHEEFENWISQQRGVLASLLEVPREWEIPFAEQSIKYVALSSRESSDLALSVGTEVRPIPFKKLEVGQLILMWVIRPNALAA